MSTTQPARNACFIGETLVSGRIEAELAQFALDVLDEAGPLADACSDIFERFVAEQTRVTPAPDLTHAALLADGYKLSVAGWNALRPHLLEARKRWGLAADDRSDETGEECWLEPATIGPAVDTAARVAA